MVTEQKRSREGSVPGIEEMNLAEFPFAVLSHYALNGSKTLEFSDEIFDRSTGKQVKRLVTITGSDKWGLPNWQDMDVLLGLIQLTQRKHRFKQRAVEFSLYELRELLQWEDCGPYKKRLKLALKRLLGVTVCYENAFRRKGRWVSLEGFHLLDNLHLTNTVEQYDPEEPQLFKWNDAIVESFRDKNTKELDWDFYLSLKSPTSKRLYRFLDKRFYNRDRWTFDLGSFCRNKVGLHVKRTSDFKKTLRPAIEELVNVGFLKKQDEKQRYQRIRKGVFKVDFQKARSWKPPAKRKPAVKPAGLERELFDRDVRNAADLVAKFPEEKIREQIKNFDHRNKHGENKGGAYLRMAIEDPNGYGFRKDYVSDDELAARKKAQEKRELANKKRDAAMLAQQNKEDAAKHEAVESYMASLAGDDERESFFEEARQSSSNTFANKRYQKAMKSNDKAGIVRWRNAILNAYIAKMGQ